MRAPVLAVILGIGALTGCLGGALQNSPLHAPKLIVDYSDDHHVELFVRNAFGERSYDRIVLTVDNETVEDRNATRAAIVKIDKLNFHLQVDVHAEDDSVFQFQGRINFSGDHDRLVLSVFEKDNGWQEPREKNVPYEHILEREEN